MRLRDEMPELHGGTDWLNSKPITKKDLLNSDPTFIHFWSISCDLCKKAMPNLNRIRDTYSDQIKVISIHHPRSEMDKDRREIRRTASDHGLTEPIIIDNQERLSKAFRLHYVPSYFLFDHSGILRFVQRGNSNTSLLEKRIKRIITNP
ncbi:MULTISPECIES: TlpA family protein disulfide reductase [Virgibacillus]|uniref:Thiol-disulfide oxidoreductase YkuV n=2 Tax=Virgibacillus TaxID=84406 RepID=A0A024QDD0_9BACI|nr:MULTISPECIES: TlpA disulfide reductase family protein [Virgibacillus]EQB36574.1 hypothetical protein M948_16200 [Virgibacillus sp. CM-4]MYL42406.1 redoxin domain-containing protein [Virgibacillus massiliensis]GGJ42794.1 thiol-disulfide oxidoreductase YkuV [Virgibacillus kapii]CDQ40272.1 Thiol-disulfide oxidoreductase YkuV [Virgibacillus massiliensis]